MEGAKARLRQIEKSQKDSIERGREHSSMRDMEPLHIPDEPDDEPRISETPRAKPSRIPRHTAHKGAAPPRPPSAHSTRSTRSVASGRSRASRDAAGASAASAGAGASRKDKSAVPVRRSPSADKADKVRPRSFWNSWFTTFKDPS